MTLKIRESLGETLHNPCLYREALRELTTLYGHPHIVLRAYLRSIMDLPNLRENDNEGVLSFSSKLRGAAASLNYGGYQHELDSGGMLERIVDKLPLSLRKKWSKLIVEAHPRWLTIQDLVDLLTTLAKRATI